MQTLTWAGIDLASLGLQEKRLDLSPRRYAVSHKSATALFAVTLPTFIFSHFFDSEVGISLLYTEIFTLHITQ